MRAFYLGGWVLVFLACFGAAAEIAARTVPNGGGFYLSAYDVWYALWPGSLVVTKIRIESAFGAWAWDPVMVSLLRAPGWALFGLPGLALGWLGWPRHRVDDDAAREEEEALFLFDSLADQAEAEAREFATFRDRLDADPAAASDEDDRPQPPKADGGA